MKKLFIRFFRWVFAEEQYKLVELLTEIKNENVTLLSTQSAIRKFIDTYDKTCQICYCDGSWAVLYLKDGDTSKHLVKFINLGEASLDSMKDLLVRLEKCSIDIEEQPKNEAFLTKSK